jgi:hypothetical protein
MIWRGPLASLARCSGSRRLMRDTLSPVGSLESVRHRRRDEGLVPQVRRQARTATSSATSAPSPLGRPPVHVDERSGRRSAGSCHESTPRSVDDEGESDGCGVDARARVVVTVEGDLRRGVVDVVEGVPERARSLDRGGEADGGELLSRMSSRSTTAVLWVAVLSVRQRW